MALRHEDVAYLRGYADAIQGKPFGLRKGDPMPLPFLCGHDDIYIGTNIAVCLSCGTILVEARDDSNRP